MGHVPVLRLPDGTHLPESQAILFFLAQGSEWWPDDAASQVQALAWMGFEQDRHMKPLAQLRLRLALHRDADPRSDLFAGHARSAHAALSVLEVRLKEQGPHGWVATHTHPSIADIALYPYTRMAPMGGIELAGYPAIQDWLARMEALPGYQALFPWAARTKPIHR